MQLALHKQWLRRFWIPSILLLITTILWGGSLGVSLYRILGVTITTVNGRPATFIDEILLHGSAGACYTTSLVCLLLLILFVGRITFSWWLIAILLLVVGSPVMLFSGQRIANYLWTLNQGGPPYETFVPQILGLASTLLIYVPLSMWISRYRFIILRRNDKRRSPCPQCGYELLGVQSAKCPECGWEIPNFTTTHSETD